MSRQRRAGQVSISDEILMEMLDFKGGTVLVVSHDPQRGATSFLLEHRDMPAWPQGTAVVEVMPAYQRLEGASGRTIDVVRTSPPKRRERARKEKVAA